MNKDVQVIQEDLRIRMLAYIKKHCKEKRGEENETK